MSLIKIGSVIGAGGGGNPGLVWAQQNAYVFHDYTRMQAAIGAAIQAGDLGLEDIGPNNIDGVPANGVLADNFLFNDKPTPVFTDTGNDIINIGQSTALKNAFKGNFEMHFLVAMNDGIVAASYNLFGVLVTGSGYVNCYIDTTGRINIGYATNVTTNAVNWRSTTVFIVNGVTPKYNIRCQCNFTTDTFTVWVNGVSSAGTFTAGTIASIDPTLFDTNLDICVGSLNNAGTIASNTNNIGFARFAVTPMAPPQSFLDYFGADYDTLWQSQIHITSSNYASKRQAIIEAIFTEGTLPTNAVPASTAAVVAGSIHDIAISEFTGYASITRAIFNRTFDTTNQAQHRIYRIVNSAPNGSVVIYCMGHSPINDQLTIQNALNNGYDVLFGAMLTTQEAPDGDNTVTTPLSAGSNHNEYEFLGISGLQLLLFDKIEAINWCEANFPYDHYYMTGISGGGWTTLMVAALDERIEKSFPIRGWKPRIYKCTPSGSLSDYEQGGLSGVITGTGQPLYDFFTTYTFEDFAALATTNGRLLSTITHVSDSATLGGTTFDVWKTRREALALSLGGEDKCFINTNGAEATHTTYQDEVDKIFEDI